ncbi:hypothetical protein EYZ11_002289 [Aspergillus tanneri]|uniref:Uncharacterized protein n=1 Tax=Aspergillus tanneri TaxID=1220188 RepID=A0A4S3JT92_9EURO|nr:hypothetical protein EYZ11_002289 [Aspergillus tanneri]
MTRWKVVSSLTEELEEPREHAVPSFCIVNEIPDGSENVRL